MNEAKIVNDCYNFIKWMLPLIAKYPRNYRYTLGVRIENSLYELLELLQRAYAASDKAGIPTVASFKLEHLRMIIRLSYDLHLFDNASKTAFLFVATLYFYE